ncbi:unnamed protein product, partial [Coregonus sp. 'balchen']
MVVGGGSGDRGEWDGRWNHINTFLERPGPYAYHDFEPSTELLQFFLDICKILVIGAGGLGCELLKDLWTRPFQVFVTYTLLTWIPLTFPTSTDRSSLEFHIIVCGLNSIITRRWMNGMLLSLMVYKDGVLDSSSIILLIDRRTEGFKGNALGSLPWHDCLHLLHPGALPITGVLAFVLCPDINFPMCTIASMPRLPEHCVEYVLRPSSSFTAAAQPPDPGPSPGPSACVWLVRWPLLVAALWLQPPKYPVPRSSLSSAAAALRSPVLRRSSSSAAVALRSPVLVSSADTVPGVNMTPAPPLGVLQALTVENCLTACTGPHSVTRPGLVNSSTFVTGR